MCSTMVVMSWGEEVNVTPDSAAPSSSSVSFIFVILSLRCTLSCEVDQCYCSSSSKWSFKYFRKSHVETVLIVEITLLGSMSVVGRTGPQLSEGVKRQTATLSSFFPCLLWSLDFFFFFFFSASKKTDGSTMQLQSQVTYNNASGSRKVKYIPQ